MGWEGVARRANRRGFRGNRTPLSAKIKEIRKWMDRTHRLASDNRQNYKLEVQCPHRESIVRAAGTGGIDEQ